MSGPQRRVAALIDNIGPYHVARLKAAAALTDVVVIETSPKRSEYDWIKPVLPPAIGYVPLTDGLVTLRRELDALSIEALALPGWSSAASLHGLQWACARRIPAIVMSDTNPWDFRRRPIIERLKRALMSRFSAALTTSNSQAAYLQALGLAPHAIFRGFDVVDNDYFARHADEVRFARTVPAPLPAAAIGRYFLSSARFTEKKNLRGLLAGYAAFRRGRADDPADWPLVLLGDGPQRAELEALRARLGLDTHIHLPGFRQIDELPAYYGSAGAFVLASVVEQWGLVVNEAMASTLPVAVSRRCGCAEVLVEEGVTGFAFEPDDAETIGHALTKLAAHPDLPAMGRAARRRVDEWGPSRFADGLDRAVRHAIDAGPPRAGIASRLALAVAIGHRRALSRGLLRPHPHG